MNKAKIRVAVRLAGKWQVRETLMPCGILNEEEAERVARSVVVPDDLGGVVEVSVPGWTTYFHIELVRFYGLGLELVRPGLEREMVEKLFDQCAMH